MRRMTTAMRDGLRRTHEGETPVLRIFCFSCSLPPFLPRFPQRCYPYVDTNESRLEDQE
jgi:hypothetical protein